MTTIRRSVPSLASLAAFEAAARHASFTLAARELGVTQAAVSRHIRRLEEDLNARLFVRAHRRVALTVQGQLLASVTTDAFGRIAGAVEAIRQPAPDDTVTIGATLAFSHFWLVPRLPAFRAAHPEVKLRLIAEDSSFDLREGRLDVAVRYGTPPFGDAVSLAAMPDRVFPVCSPALRDSLGPAADPAQVFALPLIGVEWAEATWLSWRGWAAMAGLSVAPAGSALQFNHYTDAIYAAIGGEGVMLGWERLIAGLLRDGRLVRPIDRAASPPECYHILLPAGRRPSGATSRFTDWLVRQFARKDA